MAPPGSGSMAVAADTRSLGPVRQAGAGRPSGMVGIGTAGTCSFAHPVWMIAECTVGVGRASFPVMETSFVCVVRSSNLMTLFLGGSNGSNPFPYVLDEEKLLFLHPIYWH